MENIYQKEPFIVSELNHETGLPIRSVIFLTDAPERVVCAANKYNLNGNTPVWSEACAKILESHYGPKWKSKLIPPQNLKKGGAFDESDFQDSRKKEPDEEYIITYSKISVFPEDTIFDVKQKITATLNIPYYRIHLNYKRSICPYSQVPYKIFVDNTELDVCINDMKSTDLSFPVKIDQTLQDRKDNIKLTANEHLETLQGNIKYVRIIDLATVTPSLESVDNPLLSKIMQDKYVSELLFYGGIIKYWPHLSLSMYTTFISSEKSFRSKYPNFYTDKSKAHSQQVTISEFNKSIYKSKDTGNICDALINAASIEIKPAWPIPVNIRNLFDSLHTELDIPVIRCKIKVSSTDVDDSFIVANKEKIRLNMDLPVTITKTCKQVIKKREVDAVCKFLKDAGKTNGLTALLFTPDRSKNDFSVKVTVTNTGSIIGYTRWQEDDSISFNNAAKTIKSYILDYVDKIKSIGSVAFPSGGDLNCLNLSDVNNLGCISLTTLWPYAISRSTFSEIRAEFQNLEKCSVLNSRTTQATDSYAFEIIRGLKCRDKSNILRKMSNYMNMSVEEMEENEFLWMRNSNISWKNIYSGRCIKLHHRMSDIKVEMNDIYNYEEYKYIYKFIFAILNKYKSKAVKKVYENVMETRIAPVASDRLRRLQQRDPLLYDLKRYDKNNEVYSIICQAGRQPFIYSKKEMESLPQKISKNLIKYWNFTEKEDAYYQCPDSKFSNFGFKVGHHPMGYCIPCCKSLKPKKDSKAFKNTELCLKKRIVTEVDDSGGKHVLSFGKALNVDRLGNLPNNLEYELFMGVMKEPYNLYISGVHQNTEACQTIGFPYAVANALRTPGQSNNDVFYKLIDSINDFSDYRILGNGSANKFLSSSDLANFMNRLLILNEVTFDVVTSCEFKLILGDIVRYTYGVEIITFVVTENDIELDIAADAITGICNSACRSRPNILILLEHENRTYPVYAVDINNYNKVLPELKSKFMKKLFQCNYDDDSDYPGDSVIETVVDMLRYEQPYEGLDYNLMTIICKDLGYEILERYVNKHNYYYYIKIKIDNDFLYLPTELSSFQISTSRLMFKFVEPKNSYEVLMKFIDKAKKFIKIEMEETIVNCNGKTIGFRFGSLCFFHEPIEKKYSNKIIKFQYDPAIIDKEIMLYKPKCSLSDSAILFDIKIKSYVLFLSEFYFIIKNEKNVPLRDDLYGFIKSVDVKSQKNVMTIKSKLYDLFKEHPDDLKLVRCIINTKTTKTEILKSLENIKLSSDRVTLDRLCKCKNVEEQIDKLMKEKVKIIKEYPKKYSIINMYSDCSKDGHSLCEYNKLLIREEEYRANLSILTADIKNPYKTNLFNQLNKQVFNNLIFIEYPFENIRVDYGWY